MVTLSEDGFSPGSFIFQSFLGYWGSLTPLLLLATMFHSNNSGFLQIVNYLLIAAIAVVLALFVEKLSSSARREGRLIWIIPLAVEVSAISYETYLFDWRRAVEYFWVQSGPEAGAQGWGIALLTLPTWACCCYSATMWAKRENRRSPRAL